MNKSTPINQLPSQNSSPNIFVNDQQRQIITQAQQAINNSTMPQNTQLSNEIINDDDLAIQDMLNNLNSQPQDIQQIQQIQQLQQLQQQQLQQQQHMQQQQHYQQQDDYLSRVAAMSHMMQPQLSQPQQLPQLSQTQQFFKSGGLTDQFAQLMSTELKIAGIVFIAVILVQLVPFTQYISKYIAVEKIPYHDILLKAMIATFIVIIIKKLI
jgi:hypothetical protein